MRETVYIKQATKSGYIECAVGGVADFAFPDSKTRRGRVQGGGHICPTITAESMEICKIESLRGGGYCSAEENSVMDEPIIDIYNQRLLKGDVCGTITAHGNASPTACGTFGIVEREDIMRKDKFVMEGNFNQRGVVHAENGICRTLIGQGHAGNEPKILTKHTEKGGR